MYVITRQWFYGVSYKCSDFKVYASTPLPYLGYVEVNITVTFQSDNMMVISLVGTCT
jgi:hypothetical protein